MRLLRSRLRATIRVVVYPEAPPTVADWPLIKLAHIGPWVGMLTSLS